METVETKTREDIISTIKQDMVNYNKHNYMLMETEEILKHKVIMLEKLLTKIVEIL